MTGGSTGRPEDPARHQGTLRDDSESKGKGKAEVCSPRAPRASLTIGQERKIALIHRYLAYERTLSEARRAADPSPVPFSNRRGVRASR